MNSVLVEALEPFKMSAGNIIRDSFAKTKLPPLIPNYLTTNTQACSASIQVSSGANTEEIKYISLQTVAPIELQVTRTDDPMVVLQEKGVQQSSRNIILWAAVYDAVREITAIHIQDIKKECTTTLNQKNTRLVND